MPTILFLCTGNSCRSQMAEGLVNHFAGDRWQAYSAGTRPSGYIHPLAVRVMREIGIDISHGRSQSVTDFQDHAFDRVVTVCDAAAEDCPVWFGPGIISHIPFDDPADARGSEIERLAVFRRVRDEIKSQIVDPLLEIT